MVFLIPSSMCHPKGAIPSRRVGAGRLGCLRHLVVEGALGARTVCPWLWPALCRRWGRLVSLGHVERGRKMMSSSGGIRAWGRKAESNVKKEEEKERFRAERGGTGGGSQGRRKGSLEESGRERELRRRRWEGWAVGGRRRGEGLGGEQQLGRLVVPVETGTRWRPGSSLSSSACIHSPARQKSRCSYCWQKARGCTKPLPDENQEPEAYHSQGWFKLLQSTNDLIHKNGDGYQIDLFKWTHAEEISFSSCTQNFLSPNAN